MEGSEDHVKEQAFEVEDISSANVLAVRFLHNAGMVVAVFTLPLSCYWAKRMLLQPTRL